MTHTFLHEVNSISVYYKAYKLIGVVYLSQNDILLIVMLQSTMIQHSSEIENNLQNTDL